MKYVICILCAYLLGSLSPAALVSKIKHKKIDKECAGNLGATSTMERFGAALGILVMIFDIFKGFLAVTITAWVAPEIEWLGMAAGFGAVIGHCYPFYLKFKGGKGLAAFGGVMLAYNPWFFLAILISGAIFVFITNCGTVMAYYAAVLFPIFVTLTSNNIPSSVICIILSLFIMILFIPSLKKAIKGQDFKARSFIRKQFQKKSGQKAHDHERKEF